MRGRREGDRNAGNLGFTESARYREPVLKTGVAFARFGRIDRRIRGVTSRLDTFCTFVTIDS
jgi:hypothetical protein